jgi:hypothetical protein
MGNNLWPHVEAPADPSTMMSGEALPSHALQNVGDADLVLISVELKEANG